MATTTDVLDRTGITMRQCDYWIRAGWIRATERTRRGSGSARDIPEGEVLVAEVMAQLVRFGFLPRDAHRVTRELLTDGQYHAGPLHLIYRPDPKPQLEQEVACG